ncbi:uncharacterized protein LOC132271761 [Cornus florida]|uniref:uncharacterized protein LOC132271761 n=1 Tax=Cornus florida TaxID=4283 RepID=UPI0028982819|nr:uncharacterized protein LOC132271761 [Cornus florida]
MRKVQQIVTLENPKQIGYKQEENFEPVNVALSEDLGNDKRLLKESKKYMVLTDPSNSSANSSLEKNLGIKSLIQSPIAEHQNVDTDKTQKPILHSSKFAHWFLEEEKELAGGLIAIDDPVITQHSKPMPNMASIIHTQQEAKLSPKAGSDDTVDSTGEICWPDEDSLIAIDDLIIPEHSMSMHSGKLTEAYILASNVTVDIADKSMALNVAHHDEGSTVPAVGNSAFLAGPYDTMGSGFPFHNPL